jgi:hypothetical protein
MSSQTGVVGNDGADTNTNQGTCVMEVTSARKTPTPGALAVCLEIFFDHFDSHVERVRHHVLKEFATVEDVGRTLQQRFVFLPINPELPSLHSVPGIDGTYTDREKIPIVKQMGFDFRYRSLTNVGVV